VVMILKNLSCRKDPCGAVRFYAMKAIVPVTAFQEG
jgi:hypothetical protein